MSPNNKDVFLKETDALHNLRALEEIDKNPKISQRELAGHLGVALGITNALLKTLVRKGLIKIRGENNRSLSYHLTHAGVLHKSKLAVRWTLNTMDFYRSARREVAKKMAAIATDGVKTVVLYGISEFAEIAVIVAHESGLEVQGFVDGSGDGSNSILGLQIGPESLIDDLKPDAVIVCIDGDSEIEKNLSERIRKGTRLYRLVESGDVI